MSDSDVLKQLRGSGSWVRPDDSDPVDGLLRALADADDPRRMMRTVVQALGDADLDVRRRATATIARRPDLLDLDDLDAALSLHRFKLGDSAADHEPGRSLETVLIGARGQRGPLPGDLVARLQQAATSPDAGRWVLPVLAAHQPDWVANQLDLSHGASWSWAVLLALPVTHREAFATRLAAAPAPVADAVRSQLDGFLAEHSLGDQRHAIRSLLS